MTRLGSVIGSRWRQYVILAIIGWGTSIDRAGADNQGDESPIQMRISAQTSAAPALVGGADLGGGLIEFLASGEIRPKRSMGQTACPTQESFAASSDPDLGGGFLEFIVTGKIDAKPRGQRADCARNVPSPAPATASSAPEFRPYRGSQPPGSIIINMTRREVYRVLEDGRIAVYRTNSDPLAFVVRARLKPSRMRSEPEVTGSISGYPKWEMPDDVTMLISDTESN